MGLSLLLHSLIWFIRPCWIYLVCFCCLISIYLPCPAWPLCLCPCHSPFLPSIRLKVSLLTYFKFNLLPEPALPTGPLHDIALWVCALIFPKVCSVEPGWRDALWCSVNLSVSVHIRVGSLSFSQGSTCSWIIKALRSAVVQRCLWLALPYFFSNLFAICISHSSPEEQTH